MKYFLYPAAGAILLLSACKGGGGNADLKNHNDSLSYALGISMAQSLEDGELTDINYDILRKALQDFRDSTEALDVEAADAFIREEIMAMQNKKTEEYRVKNEAYLEENKGKEGVQVTASGLQYKVLSEGMGVKPDADDSVTVHYTGKLIDGTIFDSSVERGEPVTFEVGRVIPGWTEGLQLMGEGSKYQLVIPQNLGYGFRQAGKIEPMSTLVFEVELLKVHKVN